MPDHIHGIIRISENITSALAPHSHKWPHGTATGSIGRVVQAFKSCTIHMYIQRVGQQGWQLFPGKLWQRNYYEHIIRNEQDLHRIREYILCNPSRWKQIR